MRLNLVLQNSKLISKNEVKDNVIPWKKPQFLVVGTHPHRKELLPETKHETPESCASFEKNKNPD